MKQLFNNKVLSILIILSLTMVLFAGCGKKETAAETTTETTAESTTETAAETSTETATEEAAPVEQEHIGTILWLSNLSSGLQYETAISYLTMLCDEFGYDLAVVFGDMFNDPAGNLAAVKNNMTDDIVGLIASQDGGLKDIMAAYPNLFVAGYNIDMKSVYDQGGVNAELTTNPNFLGTISDGYFDGALLGKQYADEVVAKGYKKVSVIKFPGFAYPVLDQADAAFIENINTYNASASDADKITVVGETKVLEFQPLEETYFFEEGYSDLDAIVGFCAGVDFIYPILKTAISNGTCSADTKLLTGGFNNDSMIVSDIGGEGVIQYLSISPSEDVAWAFIMLDNAITGNMYADYTQSIQLSSLPYVIDSKEAIDNVLTKGMTGTGDITLAQITLEDIKGVMVRFNSSATFEDLKALFSSEKLSTAALK